MSKRKRGKGAADEAVERDEDDNGLSRSDAADAGQASSSAAAAAASSAAGATSTATPKSSKSSKAPKPHPSQALYANTRHWLMKNEVRAGAEAGVIPSQWRPRAGFNRDAIALRVAHSPLLSLLTLSLFLLCRQPPFSLAALRDLPDQREPWVGVRNHQAKCMMVHGMKRGHRVLYYNASVANPHIAGLATVASEVAYPDHTAFDKSSCYFDPKSDPKAPTWFMVDVQYEREFSRPVYLAELRLHDTGSKGSNGGAEAEEEEDAETVTPTAATADAAPPLSRAVSAPAAASGSSAAVAAAAAASPLSNFTLFTRRRLSIHPLTAAQFDFLCSLEGQPLPEGIKLKPEKKKSTAAAAAASAATNGAGAAGGAEEQKQMKTKAAGAAAMDDDDDAASASESAARPSTSRSKSVPSAGRGSNKRAKKS